jgi:mono/diheme cytochrome c family protein
MLMEKMKNMENKNSFFDWRLPALLAVLAIVGLCAVIFLFFLGQNYGRMNKDAAVNVYQMKMPDRVKNAVPLNGDPSALTLNEPEGLKNPLTATQENINSGALYYNYYCIQCHGVRADGKGTVGQSFSPLPADLRSDRVQAKSDGLLFRNLTLGYKRQPPLGYTVSETERWAIILYIRSLTDSER